MVGSAGIIGELTSGTIQQPAECREHTVADVNALPRSSPPKSIERLFAT